MTQASLIHRQALKSILYKSPAEKSSSLFKKTQVSAQPLTFLLLASCVFVSCPFSLPIASLFTLLFPRSG